MLNFLSVLRTLTGAFLLLLSTFSQAEEAFPHREAFNQVETIELQELRECFEQCLIVDVRSRQEHFVININTAMNFNLKKPEFTDNIQKLRNDFPGKKIVFYCNGHTCKKSYQAVMKVMKEKPDIQNIAAFDAGVFDWAKTFPELTTLLGETPLDPEKIISKQAFHAKKIDYQTFLSKDDDPNVLFIDIRDEFQRTFIPDVKPVRHIPFDHFLKIAMQNNFRKKELVFFDSVSKQVRWLQYMLEKLGYENYYFLDGGVDGVADKSKMTKSL